MYVFKLYQIELFTGSHTNRDMSPYVNFNLTEKPVANYEPYYIYQWWKYGHDQTKYINCDQYRCQSKEQNECNAIGTNTTPNQVTIHDKNSEKGRKYFENASLYCAYHPDDARCPNYRVPVQAI
jgi:hypothetical protein